jgi:hypothetical protein
MEIQRGKEGMKSAQFNNTMGQLLVALLGCCLSQFLKVNKISMASEVTHGLEV